MNSDSNVMQAVCSAAVALWCMLGPAIADNGSQSTPPGDWAGLYLGVNAGGARAENRARTMVLNSGGYFITTDPAQIAGAGKQNQSASDFIGGIQAGHNWQAGRFVIGVEADVSNASIRTSRTTTVGYFTTVGTTFTVASSASADWLATLRARAGYAFGNWFAFGTAGLAFAKVRHAYSFSDTAFSARESASVTDKRGWAAGGGLEVKLRPNWTMKGEYLFVDLGRVGAIGEVSTTQAVVPATLSHNSNLKTQIGRIGLNYRF